MIQANELRIGNLLRYTKDKTLRQSLKGQTLIVSSDDIVYIENGNFSHIYEPIPLSPEILEKCGFENENGEFTHPDNTDFDLMFCCSENGVWCAYNFGNGIPGRPFVEKIPAPFEANPICNPFKYLHQLQNLYFALTGTELTVNL